MTLCVLDAYRGLGIGSSLLKSLVKAAQAKPELGFIYLHVHTANEKALKFYDGFNFKYVTMLLLLLCGCCCVAVAAAVSLLAVLFCVCLLLLLACFCLLAFLLACVLACLLSCCAVTTCSNVWR